jgi:RNA polymerase sigma-70 factor (ECF subfamily)
MTRRGLKSRLEKFEREALCHLDGLLRAAKRTVYRHQEAEDVVQETYLRAWKYFDSFDAGSNCRAWLFRIMFNVINARKGKEARMPESPFEDSESESYEQGSRGNVVVFDPLRQIEGQEILELIGRLSDEHRVVLWLCVVEEFTYREAAEVLEVPIGTVMSRLHRARRELRKLIMIERRAGQS